ncbi:MAG: hypothetical protein WA432_03350 [Candidatus Babeliaceae bacterium]
MKKLKLLILCIMSAGTLHAMKIQQSNPFMQQLLKIEGFKESTITLPELTTIEKLHDNLLRQNKPDDLKSFMECLEERYKSLPDKNKGARQTIQKKITDIQEFLNQQQAQKSNQIVAFNPFDNQKTTPDISHTIIEVQQTVQKSEQDNLFEKEIPHNTQLDQAVIQQNADSIYATSNPISLVQEKLNQKKTRIQELQHQVQVKESEFTQRELTITGFTGNIEGQKSLIQTYEQEIFKCKKVINEYQESTKNRRNSQERIKTDKTALLQLLEEEKSGQSIMVKQLSELVGSLTETDQTNLISENPDSFVSVEPPVKQKKKYYIAKFIGI